MTYAVPLSTSMLGTLASRLAIVESGSSGYATTGYVDGKISDLLGGAPAAALDTLKELADALAADQSAVASLTTSLATKAAAVHGHAMGDITGLSTALSGKTDTGTTTALAARVTAAETAASTLNGKVVSLETWRAAKATASPDVTTSYHFPTAVITLGLNAPTSVGIDAAINTIMGEVNGIKAILRTREILAAA